MNFMIFLTIITAMLLVYCSIVIPLGKQTSEEELEKIYEESDLNQYLSKLSFENTIQVSRSIVNSAKLKQEEYVWKYFYKDKTDEEILEQLNAIETKLNKINLNAQRAYEKAEAMKAERYDKCMSRLIYKFPLSKAALPDWNIIRPLTQNYNYIFLYVSPQGRSSLKVIIPFNHSLKSYIIQKIKYKNSAKGQRNLMTDKLRKKILERDNYTCQNCGNSTYNEPNLLLEVDHIIPVSKGGKTIENNLQTLCWKCNRSKSNK